MHAFNSVHPGEILAEEIEAREMTPNALSVKIKVPASRVGEILKGKRAITADTALRLGRFLGTGPELWMNLQSSYELWKADKENGARIAKEVDKAA